MKANCPATCPNPSRLILRRNSSDRDTGLSTIATNAGKRAARYAAAMWPDPPSVVSSATVSALIENLVGDCRHRHRPHAVTVLQATEMIENFTQERQVRLQIDAKIVR